jgi:hypothetical protein
VYNGTQQGCRDENHENKYLSTYLYHISSL